MTTATQYKPYPKYKSSGTDWLGKIPSEWETKRLRYYFDYHAGGVWGDEENGNGNNMICFRVADFDFNHFGLSENDLTVRNIPENQHSRILEKGDILLEKSGGGEKQTVGRAVRFNEGTRAVCSNFIEKLTPLKTHDSKFISYLMGALYFETINTRSIKQTTGIQNLDLYSYLCEVVPFPSKETQKSIAGFLDRKTARIDGVMDKKQKLIDLLKEKRQALITHAVTKGLDPKAKMKPSGIDWLGDIPEGWGVKKLKYVARSNISSLAENTAPDYLFKYLDIGNVGTGFILEEPTEMYFENAPSRARRIVKKNDTIISTVRTYLKAIYHFENDPKDLIVSTGFAVIETGKKINPKFFYYLSLSENFIDSIVSNSYGVSYPAINESFLMTLPVWYPKIEEQKEIVAFLDTETAKIDGIIKKVEMQIEKLQEYRQALISNAVTGKIKV
ncbi:MAG: restriction endonuclease subunit S [Candidatus Liptonbacteria bacterium]|nr:restriction endonuclease subunit S [Candidatus Liptonbacteria bacterium]